MDERGVIAQITWLVGAVSVPGGGRLSLGYCCMGRGVFLVIPTGRRAGWLYNLYPLVVDEVREKNGGCEFASYCFVLSCPLNRATYDSIARANASLGVKSPEDARKLVEKVGELFEGLLRENPWIGDALCKGYNIAFRYAPIRLATSTSSRGIETR
jgi:hypothetical protein